VVWLQHLAAKVLSIPRIEDMKPSAAFSLCVLLPLAACEEKRASAPVATTTASVVSAPAARNTSPLLGAAKPSSLFPAPGKPPPATARWDGVTTTLHHDAESKLSFAIPAAGYRLATEHFDASLPVHVTKAIFTLFGAGGPAVTIDVWDVPAGTSLLSFFEQHLAFMIVSTTKVVSKTEAYVQLDEPRSPQSYARRAVVFPAPGRIVRVTCHDTTEHGAVSAFEQVMKTLPKGAAP